jgi:hypothetical protein
MIRLKTRFLLVASFLVLLAGCSHCLLLRSEYVDVTGRVHVPRSPDADLPILEKAPETPYQNIGWVKVLAEPEMSREAVIAEMKRRALMAGADALIDLQIEENTSSKFVFCGRVFSTTKHLTAQATAIVFPKPASSKDAGKNPAMFGL